MWVMSIIGVIFFSLVLIFMIGVSDTDLEAAIGLGLLGMVYGIAYSIVGIATTRKKKRSNPDSTQELIRLNELKEKGILTDDEFQRKKQEILDK